MVLWFIVFIDPNENKEKRNPTHIFKELVAFWTISSFPSGLICRKFVHFLPFQSFFCHRKYIKKTKSFRSKDGPNQVNTEDGLEEPLLLSRSRKVRKRNRSEIRGDHSNVMDNTDDFFGLMLAGDFSNERFVVGENSKG